MERNYWLYTRLPENETIVLRALSGCFLFSDRLGGAVTSAMGSMFQ